MGIRGWMAVVLAVTVGAAPAFAGPPCSTKRVDPCGCHHVYGIRHCHANRKSAHCELPASAKVTVPKVHASTTF